ncbi:MAG: hypothetical protein RLZZ450_4275 [Pseudomonadota bacterium]|jgi:hypothetical protein
MKPKLIAYWITTALVAFVFVGGGTMDLLGSAEVIAGMAALGYPAYFATILGVWKVLGAGAVLVPGLPRVKEWAYAGMFFDLTGAAISHASVSDPAGKVITPLVITALLIASWRLRPASRVLGTLSSSASATQGAQPLSAQAA